MTDSTLLIKRAPHWALLFVLALGFSWMGRIDAIAAPPAKPLLELESHIQWSAVDAAWKGLRDPWVAKTGDCADAKCVASQLLTLEQHVEWKAVDPKWKTRRPDWVNECKSATTDAQVSSLLLEFERYVGWGAVDGEWKGVRDAWIARVKD